MLTEWALYLTAPAPIAFRRLGYVRESVSLYSRSRRCRSAWRPHLDATRAVIREALAGLAQRRTAIVLGSGLLDDIPLAALAGAFEHVRLVDAVHLWPARMVASRYRNVERVSLDIGGTARMLLEGTSEPEDTLTAICARADVDLVISANLLSQLPILPLDWYDSRGRPEPPALARSIVAAHVDALTRTRARVCLITDVVERELDRNGRELDRLDLLHGHELPPADRVWDWDLAPFGEAEPGRRLVHRVQAYPDWHRALSI
ncbi:hypothetical protein U8607_14055 [Methylobacterium durans]|uniref:hypothetical protein n=1 Tax=Methylobacterium durans TaxID=2202825 RepID=UPI002AFF88A8|nr:hypothetical protein [Methylobacterium durans]MEA1833204.1 hypothetical protein [Methylobacterium durans]